MSSYRLIRCRLASQEDLSLVSIRSFLSGYFCSLHFRSVLSVKNDPSWIEMGDRHLFIGNLCQVKMDELRRYCEQFGPLIDLTLNRDKENNVYHCFAFVTFQSSKASTLFMSKRPHRIDSEEIFVKRALSRAHASIPERLVVTNRLLLTDAHRFERRKIRRHFQTFGRIRKFDYSNGWIDFEDYDPVDCVLLARPHFIEEQEISVTKKIPTEAEIESMTSPVDHDLKRKYDALEKEFQEYKLAKEKEFQKLRSELERTKEDLSDITQIKLDKLIKSQQLLQQQLSTHLRSKRKTSPES